MRVFKTKSFTRFARRQGIADASLSEAIDRAGRGLVDADLGGGLVKQPVARAGQGRSGGYRVLLALRAADRAVFLFGFAKSDRADIEPSELVVVREVAASWLVAGAEEIATAISEGLLIEVDHDGESNEDDQRSGKSVPPDE